MIDIDVMKGFIREANPVPDVEQLDEGELARFAVVAEAAPVVSVGDQPVARHHVAKRGLRVAVGTAAIALGTVAVAVILLGPFAGTDAPAPDASPIATGEAGSAGMLPNPALYTKRLAPYPSDNPPPISTVIGDLEFEMLQFESSAYSLWQVVWTNHGVVSVDNGRLYWSTDLYSWMSIGSVDGNMVTVVGDDIIVLGNGASTRYVWDGGTWVVSDVLLTGGANQIVFGPAGAVALSGSTFRYSTDGVNFSAAAQAPSSVSDRGSCPEGGGWFASEPLLLGTNAGYVALLPTLSAWWSEDPVCESVVWFSVDGNVWELVAAESPFGEESVVSHVAERGGRFVAVSADYQSPTVVWISDDGIVWERTDTDLAAVDGLFAGELGWVITGADPDYGRQLMMFSADGITWDGPYERPETLNTGYFPPQIAVGDDVIFGIGGGHFDVLIARVRD